MGRYKQENAVAEVDLQGRFQPSWPVNEVVLNAALARGLPLDEIARSFGVSVEDVTDLCETYGLELGQQ